MKTDDLIYDFRTKAVNGNWRKWGPVVMIVEALDKRISTLDKGDTLQDGTISLILERLIALEESVGAGLTELSLTDEVGGLSCEFARMTEERNELRKRITALETTRTDLECGLTNVEMRMDMMECPIEWQKSTPLPCCEGCADYPCDHEPREWLVPARESTPVYCYREKRTCGECNRPWHKEGRAWVLCDEEPRDSGFKEHHPDRPACPNFEAVK